MSKIKKILFISFLIPVMGLKAAVVAVIDSGVDGEHEALKGNMWVNPLERDDGWDEDRNGYQDDLFGWNFVEDNPKIIDRSLIGAFSEWGPRFYRLQSKILLHKGSREEKLKMIKEMRAMLEDKKRAKEIGQFGTFIHGTHVASVAARKNFLDPVLLSKLPHFSANKILAVKILPTGIDLAAHREMGAGEVETRSLRLKIIKGLLGMAAKIQTKSLQEVAYYVGQHGVEVANGSFGISWKQVEKIVARMFKIIFFRAPKEAELVELRDHFFGLLDAGGKRMLDLAPDTLFVFAAGNNASDNDTIPAHPANLRRPNTLTVAATLGHESLAVFSNYGGQNVDIAAPGVAILGAVPGGGDLPLSGTSMATPIVAATAAQMRDVNPNLSPLSTKRLLMGTVDLKAFLKGKVLSGGILNGMRAKLAAYFSISMPIREAISLSRLTILDDGEELKGHHHTEEKVDIPRATAVMASPPSFYLKEEGLP
ncbi:MAG: S8 family serine peptidase [Bacteriovoracales bacterium]|nr:S8 family serine peptidase [Bacteriovoracales bacterium]